MKYAHKVFHHEHRHSNLASILHPLARELDQLTPEALIAEARELGGLAGYVLALEAARSRN